MDSIVVRNYISVIDRLDLDSKLALLSALTDSIKSSLMSKKANKSELLNELYGSWSDVDESNLIDDIYEGRSIPDRDISFD
ncbi:hypothetical protein GGR27_004045 [Lewinella antarctica]|uniref:Uncharacterized protein n=1 Tax=Neolewinella antarctica TaxID=442734 RepID=A0ABX0XH90_9BACT|nr:hypothetical protein [Neolewinella antarctica]